jgi:hypothetical protein
VAPKSNVEIVAAAQLHQLRAGVRRPHGIDVEMLAEEAAIAQIGSGAKV